MAGPRFDDAMRAEIRRRLKAYQERHDIGVPTLWNRVLDADPKRRDFSQKTMQRLLDDSHKTDDGVYDACLLFLASPQGEDPAVRLGETFAGLFGAPPAGDEATGKPVSLPADLAGTWHVYAHGAVMQPGEAVPADADLSARFDIPYSVLVLSAVPKAPWLRAVEYVGNPRRRIRATSAFNAAAETCVGALIALYRPRTYLVALKGFMLNHPKFYLLTDRNLFPGSSPPILDGHFLDREPVVAAESVFASVRVVLRPQPPDPESESIDPKEP